MYIPAMTIGTRLDEAMAHREIRSQSALARLSGVPQPTINRILKGGGKKGPETATIKKLADALEVRAEWLAEGVGEMIRPRAEIVLARSEGWSELTRVDATEHRLLTLYRRADPRGRLEMEAAWEEIAKDFKG